MSNQLERAIAPFQNFNPEKSLTLTDTTKPVRLTSEDTPCRMVRVVALSTNTGNIFLGSQNINSTNATITLQKGKGINISINNVKHLFAISATSGDKINFVSIT